MVWYTHVFKNFPQFVVIHTVKGLARLLDTKLLHKINKIQRYMPIINRKKLKI